MNNTEISSSNIRYKAIKSRNGSKLNAVRNLAPIQTRLALQHSNTAVERSSHEQKSVEQKSVEQKSIEQKSGERSSITLEEEEKLSQDVIKNCPMCDKPTFHIGGCAYMKCSDSEPKSECLGEWCWLCTKPKYKLIPGKEHLGLCDDKSHNSH